MIVSLEIATTLSTMFRGWNVFASNIPILARSSNSSRISALIAPSWDLAALTLATIRAFSRLTLLHAHGIRIRQQIKERLHNVKGIDWMVAPQTFKYVHDACVHVPFDDASKRPVPVKVGNFTAEQEGVPLTTQ